MSQETCCSPKDGCLPRKNLSKPAFVFMLQIDSHACSGMVLFLESPCEQEEIVMNVNWFKNPDHVVYADMEEFVENFSKETGISNLRAEIEAFDLNPVKEGKILKGRKRTSLKLMIPNMVFDEAIEMGDNVWVYMGENYECYCLYNVNENKGEDDGPHNYKFFSHTKCEYFPCHETDDEENFNCIFCYCPLYSLGRKCGGNYYYMENGVKDCSGCLVPHRRDNYDYLIKKMMRMRKPLTD